MNTWWEIKIFYFFAMLYYVYSPIEASSFTSALRSLLIKGHVSHVESLFRVQL